MPEDTCIVLVFDTDVVRAGAADPFAPPSVLLPTTVGVLYQDNVATASFVCSDDLDGATALGLDVRDVRSPFDALTGLIVDWPRMEALCSRSLARAIAAASASGKSGRLRQQRQALASTAGQPPALLAVPTAWPRRDRERLVQLFFEKFGVCGLYIGDRALMTTYGAGQHLSALVIDMGWDGVEITPVIDTVVMDQARAHLALGGKHLHIAIRRGLDADIQFKREYGQAVDETLVRYLVDNVCDLAPAPFETDASKGRKEREIARTTITTDDLKYSVGDVRQRAFEILFSPKQALASTGLIIPLGLGDLVNEALLSCDMDKRAALLQNIIVTGPMSHLKGLKQRLEKEIAKHLPLTDFISEHQPREIRFGRMPEYLGEKMKGRVQDIAWLGSSIASKLIFPDSKNFLTKADYNHAGPRTLATKGY